MFFFLWKSRGNLFSHRQFKNFPMACVWHMGFYFHFANRNNANSRGFSKIKLEFQISHLLIEEIFLTWNRLKSELEVSRWWPILASVLPKSFWRTSPSMYTCTSPGTKKLWFSGSSTSYWNNSGALLVSIVYGVTIFHYMCYCIHFCL